MGSEMCIRDRTIGQQTVDAPPLVLVKARQYGWEFHYAGADQKIRTEDDVYCENLLVVPADQNVVLQLESRDVIHSFFVPELRLKQDIVPGMNHIVWFNAKAADQLEVLCTELCGEGHIGCERECESLSRISSNVGWRPRLRKTNRASLQLRPMTNKQQT